MFSKNWSTRSSLESAVLWKLSVALDCSADAFYCQSLDRGILTVREIVTPAESKLRSQQQYPRVVGEQKLPSLRNFAFCILYNLIRYQKDLPINWLYNIYSSLPL